MVLVDSSVLIDFLNNNKFNDEIKTLISSNTMCTTPIIIMEVLQGIRDDKKHSKIKRFLESLPIISIEYEDYLHASHIYRTCRKQGKTIRKSIDCLIASVVINNDLILFNNDKDFDNIRSCFQMQGF